MKNEMKCIKFMLVTVAGVLAMQGCSSTPKTWEEMQAEHEQKQSQTAAVVADELPSWYVKKTPDNAEFIYVVASASAKTLNLAEQQLSVRLHGEVAEKLDIKTDTSSTEVSSVSDGIGEQGSTALQRVKRSYAFAQTTAYETVEKKVVFKKGRFVVFEMARFPIGKWRVQQQQKQNEKQPAALNTPAGFDEAVEKMDKLKAQQQQ